MEHPNELLVGGVFRLKKNRSREKLENIYIYIYI